MALTQRHHIWEKDLFMTSRWRVLGLGVALLVSKPAVAEQPGVADFAALALSCVHKEYPNHISHNLQSDADVAPPRELTPAFTGALIGIVLCTATGCWRVWQDSIPTAPMLHQPVPRWRKA